MFNFVNQNASNENMPVNNSNLTVDFDALQKARQDLISEIDAIMEYDEHIHTTSNAVARETWEHIKDEELNHVGELLGLLKYLDVSQVKYVLEGLQEFEDRLKN